MSDEACEVKPMFRNISGDDPDPEVTEIESLCMNCGENGITRILLTKIPFYKEVIMMSFSCEKCGMRNNEIQPGGKIEDKGVRLLLQVETANDLNRQVVKSDFTSINIPELEFEIPAQSQKGEVTTIEGIMNRAISALEQDQAQRATEDPDIASQISVFLEKFHKLKEMHSPFSMIFRDISGNCFIENPNAPTKDQGTELTHFSRTSQENNLLGIYTTEEIGSENKNSDGIMRPIADGTFKFEDLEGEIHQFKTNCPGCQGPCNTNMKVTNIPHFKEVLIMATSCDLCGHRSNEVKSGGGIEPMGLRIEVRVTDRSDFSRDVLKSETCSLSVPELDLEVGGAALGGRFTTIEGLLAAMREQLSSHGCMFSDSANAGATSRMATFLEEFDTVLSGGKSVTLVLDDPAGNSYVQSLLHPEPDPGLTITKYERTFHHNEELGLNDMKTEDYEEK